MKSLLLLCIPILFFQTFTYPQSTKPAYGHFGKYLYPLMQQEQLLSDSINCQAGKFLTPGPLVGKLAGNNSGRFRPVKVIIESTLKCIYTYDNKGSRTSETLTELRNGEWVNSRRTTNYYDKNGSLIAIYYDNGDNSTWLNVRRIIMTYNNSDKMIVQRSESLSNGKWEQGIRYVYTYDKNSFQNGFSEERWENGTWGNSVRDSYTNDDKGNRLTFLREVWKNGAWTNLERYTNTYDNNSNLLTTLHEIWQDGAWVNELKVTETYDGNGNMLTHIYEEWLHGAWVNQIKDTYTYDSNGNELSRLNQWYDNGGWKNYTRMTSSFSDDGRTVIDLEENWQNDNWVSFRRDVLNRDANEKVLSKSREYWTDGKWFTSNKIAYTFDFFGNAIKGVSLGRDGSSWKPIEDFLEFYYNDGNDYLRFHTSEVEVEYAPAGTESHFTPGEYSLSQNYPNPFNSSTTINYSVKQDGVARLSVYDILGNRIAVIMDSYKTSGEYSIRFDGTDYPSGVYFYRLEAGGAAAARKFILLK